MEIIGHYMPSQGKQYCELFGMFSELHKIGSNKDDQDISLTVDPPCWVPQHHPNTRDKQGFKGTYFRGEEYNITSGPKASLGAWKNCWTHYLDV